MSINASPRNAVYLEGYSSAGVAAYLAVMGSPVAIALPSAVSSPVYGITAETIAATSYGNVQVGGVAVWTAGEEISAAAIAAGARLYAGTDGKAYLFDAAAGVNQAVVGIPITPASGDGKLFSVLLGAGGIGQGA